MENDEYLFGKYNAKINGSPNCNGILNIPILMAIENIKRDNVKTVEL